MLSNLAKSSYGWLPLQLHNKIGEKKTPSEYLPNIGINKKPSTSLMVTYFLTYYLSMRVYIYTSVACAIGPSGTTSSTDFSFQNLGFWNLFEFSAAKII